MGACLANIDLLENGGLTSDEQGALLQTIRELLATMITTGAERHLIWRNPTVQAIFVELIGKKSEKEDFQS
jgi:hypothetical protein